MTNDGTAMAAPADPAPVTEDTLLGGRVRLLQPAVGYRAAIDPVLLAAAVPAKGGDTVLELGAGAGAALFCLLARVPDVRPVALERQAEMADLARRSAALNDVADRLEVVTGDLRQPPPELSGRRFAQVMFNPPFHEAGRHTPSGRPQKAASHGEEAVLADWIGAALRLLEARGRLTLIHRADRLDELLGLLAGRFGDVRVFPLWPRTGEPATRVIMTARRNARGAMTLLPGLVLHGEGGGFTVAAEAVLRHGAALPLVEP